MLTRLVEKIWFENHPMKYLSAPLLWPLSKLFSCIATYRRNKYLTSPTLSYRPPVPVIIVGNITVGGNGKTPVVMWLIEKLRERGFTPGVVSRGYGGKSKRYPLVLDMETNTDEAGDEPVLIYQRTQCPVAVSPLRSDAVKALLPLGVDIIISDDGLQHYKLARDVEIVVVDGDRRFGNQAYLPLGPLREGLERLKQVDFIVCNGAKAQQGEIAMSLIPQTFIDLASGQPITLDNKTQVIAMAGIGNPQRFFNTLNAMGISLQATHTFEDHQAFSLETLLSLTQENQALVMTEKDAVKCRFILSEHPEIIERIRWWYLPVNAEMSDIFTEKLFNQLVQLKEKYCGSQTT